jgi:hypothetical protein
MRARDVFAALLLAAASIRLSGQVVSADSARPPAHDVGPEKAGTSELE